MVSISPENARTTVISVTFRFLSVIPDMLERAHQGCPLVVVDNTPSTSEARAIEKMVEGRVGQGSLVSMYGAKVKPQSCASIEGSATMAGRSGLPVRRTRVYAAQKVPGTGRAHQRTERMLPSSFVT